MVEHFDQDQVQAFKVGMLEKRKWSEAQLCLPYVCLKFKVKVNIVTDL